MVDSLIKELSRLSKNERILLVEALWDSIVSESSDVEIPEHHKAILEERLKSLDKERQKAVPWDEIKNIY